MDKENLVYGDIVLFAGWEEHKPRGIYVGNGEFVHSPRQDVVNLIAYVGVLCRLLYGTESASLTQSRLYKHHL